MRRLLAAAALLMLGGVSGAAATNLDVGFPRYVNDQGNWAITSNHNWTVGPAVKATELMPRPVLITAYGGEKSAVLWDSSCGRGQQTTTFSRDIEIPGIPAQVMFVFGIVAYPVLPIASAELVVNGQRVLDVPASVLTRQNEEEFQLPSSAVRHFRFGRNQLQVVVTKRAQPASDPICNVNVRKSAVGVLFALSGASSADLSVSPGKAPVQYERGSPHLIQGVFTAHNAGPSAAVPGVFSFRAQIGFLTGAIIEDSVTASAPFGKCTVNRGGLSLSCPYTLFPAGATGTIRLSLAVKIPADEPPDGVYQILADWNLTSLIATSTYGGTRDPVPGNNSKSESIYLCGQPATDPKCPAGG